MKPNKQDRDLHNKVDNLTTLLEALRIELRQTREEQRRDREELARARIALEQARNRIDPITVHATRVETPTARRVPEPRAARASPPPARRAARNPQLTQREGPEFQVGDRIVVLNRHRGQQGRTATVTRVFGNKVYFEIDGNPTYRWAHNVERID